MKITERRIILITGASSGIGRETARILARQGHTLIIHGRDVQKTKAVLAEIQKETSKGTAKSVGLLHGYLQTIS
ncbi:SDR family NAD(P)-dependent oxidoreductase [Muricomes intestini]|jgi:short-subunit dehydrogenase|uniref:SDR family NAD(P)-dependent oxidoreductase n=1 Tax=Muricomes intestini TaxID=1796634 RepID=UPI002FE23113